MSLRVKKYRKLSSFSSPAITSFALVSKGRRMERPKLDSRVGPSWPAFMMPSPAPVMAIQLSAAISWPNWRAA